MKTGGQTFDGYMGAVGWKGANIDTYGYLNYKDINKIAISEMRKRYPGVKFSARGRSYSGGQSTTFKIYLKYEDAFLPEEELKKNFEKTMYKRERIPCRDKNGKVCWVEPEMLYGNGDMMQRAHEFNMECLKNEKRYQVNKYWVDDDTNLRENVKAIVKDAISIISSFVYDDSNSMCDYFDRNLYDDYEVVIV